MAAQKGKDVLIKAGDGAQPTEVFTTIGGMRSKSISINNEIVDVTNSDSAGKRELLAEGGVQSMSISGSGVFLDDAGHTLLNTNANAATINNYEFVIPGLGSYKGAFQVTSYESGGEHNGEVTFSASFESSGAIAFTSA
jgi:TP901-1 family phage major tail protein